LYANESYIMDVDPQDYWHTEIQNPGKYTAWCGGGVKCPWSWRKYIQFNKYWRHTYHRCQSFTVQCVCILQCQLRTVNEQYQVVHCTSEDNETTLLLRSALGWRRRVWCLCESRSETIWKKTLAVRNDASWVMRYERHELIMGQWVTGKIGHKFGRVTWPSPRLNQWSRPVVPFRVYCRVILVAVW